MYSFYCRNLESVRETSSSGAFVLSATLFGGQTANCEEWRNLSDECVTMPADLIAVGVSRETSNKRPVAFSFGLSIRRCELWLAIRRFYPAIAGVSTNNLSVVRDSCECFPSRDPRIIFATKNSPPTAILEIRLEDLCTAQMRFRIFT